MAEPSDRPVSKSTESRYFHVAWTFGDFIIYRRCGTRKTCLSVSVDTTGGGPMVTPTESAGVATRLIVMYEHLPMSSSRPFPNENMTLRSSRKAALEEVGLADLEPFGKANEPPIFYLWLEPAHSVRPSAKTILISSFSCEVMSQLKLSRLRRWCLHIGRHGCRNLCGSSVNRWNGRETLQYSG